MYFFSPFAIIGIFMKDHRFFWCVEVVTVRESSNTYCNLLALTSRINEFASGEVKRRGIPEIPWADTHHRELVI